jgi:predicted acetyltransferase
VTNTKHGPSNIEVVEAAEEQQTVLANLLELYAHDFSQFHPLQVGEDGRFGYPDLPLYWSDSARRPLLVRIDGRLAGFAFVRKGSRVSGDANVWDMAEFFVVRGCRRRGFGTQAAHQVWQRFPGPWEIRVMHSNASAVKFWECAVRVFAGDEFMTSSFEASGKVWRLYSFQSPAS